MSSFFEKIAPLNNVKKITKPLFIVQGGNDPRVPLSGSQQMVDRVKANGSPVWYLMAKDEGHGFRKEQRRLPVLRNRSVRSRAPSAELKAHRPGRSPANSGKSGHFNQSELASLGPPHIANRLMHKFQSVIAALIRPICKFEMSTEPVSCRNGLK